MPTASSLAWKTSSENRRCGIGRLGECRPSAIDRDIRQATDRCGNIWASLPGAGYGQFEHKADAWLQIQRSYGMVRDWCMTESHRDYSGLGYLHHRLPVMRLLIITVITPLPTKPSATKMPENWSWRTRQLPMQMSAWCCCARCKIHEGVSRR